MEIGFFDLTPVWAILWLAIGLPFAVKGFADRTYLRGFFGFLLNLGWSIVEFLGGPITLSHKI